MPVSIANSKVTYLEGGETALRAGVIRSRAVGETRSHGDAPVADRLPATPSLLGRGATLGIDRSYCGSARG